MKNYLKMFTEFRGVTVEPTMGGSLSLHGCKAYYASHAINSHDELVAEVERLRGIIEMVISTSKELSLRSPTTQWGDGYKECALATAHALEDMIK